MGSSRAARAARRASTAASVRENDPCKTPERAPRAHGEDDVRARRRARSGAKTSARALSRAFRERRSRALDDARARTWTRASGGDDGT